MNADKRVGYHPRRAVQLAHNRETAHTKPDTLVRIIFEADAARLVQEREWFEFQQIKSLPHGRIELSFNTASLDGMDRWVFSWGTSARVLEPQMLRDEVLKIARTIVERS